MHSMKAELGIMTSGASIVNAASAMGLRGLSLAAAYTASKVYFPDSTSSVFEADE